LKDVEFFGFLSLFGCRERVLVLTGPLDLYLQWMPSIVGQAARAISTQTIKLFAAYPRVETAGLRLEVHCPQ